MDYDKLAADNAALRHQLAVLRGEFLTPSRGCLHYDWLVGNSTIIVEYDYQRAEPANLDIESPLCGPGCDACVEPISAYINGCWVDISDLLDDEGIERLAVKIEESLELEAA